MHFVWLADTRGDHNVNYIGKGDIYRKGDIYKIWNSCNITAARDANIHITTSPQQNPPNYSKELNEIGWHYFFCGVGFNSKTGIGYHCEAGLRAAINVVNELKDCTQHVY